MRNIMVPFLHYVGRLRRHSPFPWGTGWLVLPRLPLNMLCHFCVHLDSALTASSGRTWGTPGLLGEVLILWEHAVLICQCLWHTATYPLWDVSIWPWWLTTQEGLRWPQAPSPETLWRSWENGIEVVKDDWGISSIVRQEQHSSISLVPPGH